MDAVGYKVETPSRVSSEWPRPTIIIDYDKPTTRFPKDSYLRRERIEHLSDMAERGRVIEIVGGDGDGKTTLTKELERFNRDNGRRVVRVDTRRFLPFRLTLEEALGPVLENATGEGEKTLLIIDNADELWFTEREVGGSLGALRFDRRLGKLSAGGQKELAMMELKEVYISWLADNRHRLNLILTAHDKDTPSVKRFKDIGLRETLEEKLNPYRSLALLGLYSPEEASTLLRSFGITSPDLIEIITSISLFHKDLKAIACLRVDGKRIEDIFRNSIPVAQRQTIQNAIKNWLHIVNSQNQLPVWR